MKTIAADEIRDLFQNDLAIFTSFTWSVYMPWIRDNEYLLLPRDVIEPVTLQICDRSNPDRPNYLSEVNDCDDFSTWLDEIKRQAQNIIAKNTGVLLPLPMGPLAGKFNSAGRTPHQCTGVIVREGFFRLESQNGRFYELEKNVPGWGTDRIYGVMI